MFCFLAIQSPALRENRDASKCHSLEKVANMTSSDGSQSEQHNCAWPVGTMHEVPLIYCQVNQVTFTELSNPQIIWQHSQALRVTTKREEC